MGKKYKQITLSEREKIYGMRMQGKSYREIGKALGRPHPTISREMKKNRRAGEEYLPCIAQERSEVRKVEQRVHAPLKNHTVFLYVREKLRTEHWSPETIAGRLKIDHPGETITAETIYEYIHEKGKKYKLWRYLTHARKDRRKKQGRGVQEQRKQSRIPGAVSIEYRSTKANNRSQPGHWETDLMMGSNTEKTALNVTVERKTRYSIISKIQNKTAEINTKVLQNSLKRVQSLQKTTKPIVRSITSDNGLENIRHKDISKELNADWYFCAPYHSWEKGSVENMIGRIRRDIPKRTPLHKMIKEQIQWLENKLNNHPRKCLNWRTPNEVFAEQVNYYKFKKYLQSKYTKWCTSF